MSVDPIEAEKNSRLILDPKGFFVIFIDKTRKEIVVEFYEGISKKGDPEKPDTGKLMAVVRAGKLYATGSGKISAYDLSAWVGGKAGPIWETPPKLSNKAP